MYYIYIYIFEKKNFFFPLFFISHYQTSKPIQTSKKKPFHQIMSEEMATCAQCSRMFAEGEHYGSCEDCDEVYCSRKCAEKRGVMHLVSTVCGPCLPGWKCKSCAKSQDDQLIEKLLQRRRKQVSHHLEKKATGGESLGFF